MPGACTVCIFRGELKSNDIIAYKAHVHTVTVKEGTKNATTWHLLYPYIQLGTARKPLRNWSVQCTQYPLSWNAAKVLGPFHPSLVTSVAHSFNQEGSHKNQYSCRYGRWFTHHIVAGMTSGLCYMGNYMLVIMFLVNCGCACLYMVNLVLAKATLAVIALTNVSGN